MSADRVAFAEFQKRPFADHQANLVQMATEPHPGGLRITAYTSGMPLLERMSFVKVRERKESTFVHTPTGHRASGGAGVGAGRILRRRLCHMPSLRIYILGISLIVPGVFASIDRRMLVIRRYQARSFPV